MALPSHAQKKKMLQLDPSFYLFNKDWDNTQNFEEAVYFMEKIKQNDSSYTCRYYSISGPMISEESFMDSALTIPNGRFCWYNANGDLDSTGIVNKTKKDNYWYYYRNNKTYLYVQYDNGKIIEKRDYDAGIIYYADGTKETLEEKKLKDSLADLSKDTVTFTSIQVEAKYKDGVNAWVNYISKNLVTPDRLGNVLGKGKHTVTVGFTINKEGYTTDIYIFHSQEWSADAEVIRLIKNSPKWAPATVNGKPVYYRQKQMITYQIE